MLQGWGLNLCLPSACLGNILLRPGLGTIRLSPGSSSQVWQAEAAQERAAQSMETALGDRGLCILEPKHWFSENGN